MTKKADSNASALKRLKANLRDVGAIGPGSRTSTSKKIKKRGRPAEGGKIDLREKLKAIEDAMNPFELKTTKVKHDILGRRIKGSVGKPGASKQAGEINRKKSLLLELQTKNKAGGIIDRRFGENDPNMTPEEKMLERFTREKQKRARNSSIYNLEETELTHLGQSLAEIDDFDEDIGLSDEEDRGEIDQSIVSLSHFGGFEPVSDPDKKKSKAEVMKEVIAKSKLYKLERQKEKEENEELRKELDDELGDIRDLLFANEEEAQKPVLPKLNTDKDEATGEGYEDYDKYVRELASDRRAQATDRTKTEEELAWEEKERLERLEKARKRRMEGLPSDSEDEKDGRKGKRRRRAPQADDLEDDFVVDEDLTGGLGAGISVEDIIRAKADEEETGSDEEEDEEGSDEDDEEEEEDDEEESEADEDGSDYSDLEEEEDGERAHDSGDDEDDMNDFVKGKIVRKNSLKSKNKVEKKSMSAAMDELAYTFQCPASLEEFLDILQDVKLEQIPIVVHRIRVLYHIKLAAENRQKLETFFGVLLELVMHLAQQHQPIPFTIINKLGRHLFELSQQMPSKAAECFNSHIASWQKKLTKGLSAPDTKKSLFPSKAELIALRILCMIFPTSDLQHPVVTPATLLMGQYLSQSPVRSGTDLASGLFLCNLFYEYQLLSKRYIPEVINFLLFSLSMLTPKKFDKGVPGVFPLPTYHSISSELKIEKNALLKDLEPEPLEFSQIHSLGQTVSESFKVSALSASLHILDLFIQMYTSTSAFIEIFTPALDIIRTYPRDHFHDRIADQLEKLESKLERLLKFAQQQRQQPLRMQDHKPIPIATYLPKFEESYSVDRHYDPDRERSQLAKLQKQHKRERKGAIRELRRDNSFIARERLKQQREKDEKYQQKIKGIMSILEGEQSEKKKLEREKKKGN
ncbi:uncharacterized protein VTP21DRAFT_3875 [Calcarisporiella thermophila]|uniref:uncharacterized protein n=1 Tax=Calcarisporiella thermophila TaxID=911321 RepID=UPI0037432870